MSEEILYNYNFAPVVKGANVVSARKPDNVRPAGRPGTFVQSFFKPLIRAIGTKDISNHIIGVVRISEWEGPKPNNFGHRVHDHYYHNKINRFHKN